MEVTAGVAGDRLLDVHAALGELEQLDARQVEVVKLRFFAELKLQEIAALHGVSGKTIQRQWNHAKAWLFERIRILTGFTVVCFSRESEGIPPISH